MAVLRNMLAAGASHELGAQSAVNGSEWLAVGASQELGTQSAVSGSPTAASGSEAAPLPEVERALWDIWRNDLESISEEGHTVLHTALEKMRQDYLQGGETVRVLARNLPFRLIDFQTLVGIPRGLPAGVTALMQAATGNDHARDRGFVLDTLLQRKADVHLQDHLGL